MPLKSKLKTIGTLCPYCKAGELQIGEDELSKSDYIIACDNDNCNTIWIAEIKDEILNAGDYGIGGWKYAERLDAVARKTLIRLAQQTGQKDRQQAVHASKALLAESVKIKEKSIEVMEAYQEQLLTLSEHIINEFLPWLSRRIKNIFGEARDKTIERLKTLFKKSDVTELSKEKAVEFWKEEIERSWRKVDMEKIELFFAESLTANEQTKEAFQFTKDLFKDYIKEKKMVSFDDKSAKIIRQQKGE